MTIDVTVPDPWSIITTPDGDFIDVGDYIAVEHPNDLLAVVEVEEGKYDATDVFAVIINEASDEDDDHLESLWLSDADFQGDTKAVRDEVVDEFEHWLEQYKDWE